MSQISTKRGDDGTTAVIGGARGLKSAKIFTALGDLDELNACLGICATLSDEPLLHDVQSRLFDIGAEIAAGERAADYRANLAGMLAAIELDSDGSESELPALTAFILPGGPGGAAEWHAARAVCRRAERSLVALTQECEISAEILAFVNRLSDWLFLKARLAAFKAGAGDILWRRSP